MGDSSRSFKTSGSIIRINIDGSIPKDNPTESTNQNGYLKLSNWGKKSSGHGNSPKMEKFIFLNMDQEEGDIGA